MFRNAFNTITSKGTLRALRHRNYVIIELAGWFSGGGIWFYRIAMGVLTWQLTRSGFWLGAIVLAEAIPGILFAPLAGACADRYDRIFLAKIVQMTVMALTGLLAAVTIAGWINIYLLVFLTVLHGIGTAFWMPLRLALVPTLVPPEDLAPAIALHSTLFNVARFLFPALAAPIIPLWGPGLAIAINAATYLVYLVALNMVVIVNPDKRADRSVGMTANLVEGLNYVIGNQAFRVLFVVVIFMAVFMRAYQEILPGIIDQVFAMNVETGVPILVSAAGLGAVVSSLIVGGFSRVEQLLRAYLACMVASVVLLALFATTSIFWVAVSLAVFLSGTSIAVNIVSQVLIQSTVRGEIRGRVMSLYGLITRNGPAIGAIVVGSLADLVGFHWPILGCAVITAFAVIYVAGRRKALRYALHSEETKSQTPANAPTPAARA